MTPVLSMCGSAYYKIASKLARWLTIVPESKIQASTQKMVSELKTLELHSDEVMVSFDVVSLYTNVPMT